MITYQGQSYAHEPGETVLDCLDRHGIHVSSFCRSGVCQSCLLKVTEGTPPPRAQAGLKDAWKRQGLVMSCVCETTEPLTLEPSDATRTYGSRVLSVDVLSPNIVCLRTLKPEGFVFEGGQFVQLSSPELGVSRPYSVASLASDPHLEFHVAVYPGGALSPWLAQAQGRDITLTGPFGECVYVPNEPERPLILAGTGTGLAPLLAVLRAALDAGHRGPIRLYHGARTAEDLYYWSQLQALTGGSPVRLTGIYLEGQCADGSLTQGDLIQLVLSENPKPQESRTYLCGGPTFVQTLKKRLYLAGASLGRIHSDPFLPKATT